jgi:TonB-dependent SusC/RagA subfamily outer membrane receptor
MRYVVWISMILLLCACSVSQYSGTQDKPAVLKSSKTTAIEEINTPYPTLELIDYLKRVPGIQVIMTGGSPQVRIRNGISILGEQEPLYVIDNVRIGNDYSAAEAYIDVNDIRSISVLKDVSSTNLYGFQGANGVIIIHTKR